MADSMDNSADDDVDLKSPLLLNQQQQQQQQQQREETEAEDHVIIIAASDEGGAPYNQTNGAAPATAVSDDDSRQYPNPFMFLGPDSAEFTVPMPSSIDPFRNHTPSISGSFCYYEWFKLAMTIPVALIRLAIFGLSLAVGYLATKLALQGWKDRQSPMPGWRSRIMLITRICTRCILFSFGYQWIKRIGNPAPREVAPIVVSNHVSYVDPIFFFYELFPTIVASESHDSLPFVGTIIRAMQVIYVDRFSAASRKHAVSEIKGTTTNGRAIISFQLGAFIPGFPVQPVVIHYPHVHFDQSWGNISLAKLMFRMFTQFHNFMEVEYLPVIVPLESKQETAVRFAERIKGVWPDKLTGKTHLRFVHATNKQTSYAMASALNVVQTSHSYGDSMLLTRASELGRGKCSSYMVEMASVESSFGITTSEAMDLLDQFFAMNPDSNGRVKIQDFLMIYGLGYCRLSEKIFNYLDVEKMGSITFRQVFHMSYIELHSSSLLLSYLGPLIEFLLGSAHVRKQPSFWNACQTAFSKCSDDCGAADFISLNQLGDIIRSSMPSTTNESVRRVFHLFDVDNDGMISRDDFMMCLQKNTLLVAIFAAQNGQI